MMLLLFLNSSLHAFPLHLLSQSSCSVVSKLIFYLCPSIPLFFIVDFLLLRNSFLTTCNLLSYFFTYCLLPFPSLSFHFISLISPTSIHFSFLTSPSSICFLFPPPSFPFFRPSFFSSILSSFFSHAYFFASPPFFFLIS